jgi:transcriptional regulator with XRE-family HTH domain
MSEIARSNPRRRRLGARLRTLRERAGLTIERAAAKLDFSPSKLSRIENGEQKIDVHWVRSMLDLYDAAEDWSALIDQARRAEERGWWTEYGINNKGYLAEEADAYRVRNFELVYVPGLLQTEGYARAVLQSGLAERTSQWIEKEVAARMRRQRRLRDADDPVELHAIIDETVLRRPVGGPDVLRAQLQHILAAVDLPTVTVQVLPLAVGAHVGMDSGFALLSFPEPEDPDVAYLAHVAGAVHTQQESEVRRCTLVFDRLRSAALGPDDSVAFLRRVVDEP